MSIRYFRGFDEETLKNAFLNAIDIANDKYLFSLYANDYKLITLDLGIARTDALIVDNVTSFCVVDVSAGATYSIKLFDTTHDPIDQSIASKGFCVERLAKANLYLTNSAQTNYYLKLLVFRRV